MKRVMLESPFAGDVSMNLKYARACARDCLMRGEAPFASHLLYPQSGILRDEVSDERRLGMEAGFYWGMLADYVVVYTDRGISDGMREGIARASIANQPVYYRSLNRLT